MEEWVPTLRTMIALGLALLLVMLRLEASRFSAAEYDDAVDRPRARARRPRQVDLPRPAVRRCRHGDRDGRRPLPLPPSAVSGRLVVPGRPAELGHHRDHR